MKRYIDADKLLNTICDKGLDCDALMIAISEQPTADVVEVIRCKDCKYWNNETDLTYCEKKSWLGTDSTDYCSFGERSDE